MELATFFEINLRLQLAGAIAHLHPLLTCLPYRRVWGDAIAVIIPVIDEDEAESLFLHRRVLLAAIADLELAQWLSFELRGNFYPAIRMGDPRSVLG